MWAVLGLAIFFSIQSVVKNAEILKVGAKDGKEVSYSLGLDLLTALFWALYFS